MCSPIVVICVGDGIRLPAPPVASCSCKRQRERVRARVGETFTPADSVRWQRGREGEKRELFEWQPVWQLLQI